ncbi:hypothetical protein, partial [Bradyrhizobium sp. P5_C12]
PQARLATRDDTRSPLKVKPGWATHTPFPNFGKVEYFCEPGLTPDRNSNSTAKAGEAYRNAPVMKHTPRYPAYFLRIVPDRQSNRATGRSICQSSTSRPSTSLSAELIAASSSMQSRWIILIGRSWNPTINAR